MVTRIIVIALLCSAIFLSCNTSKTIRYNHYYQNREDYIKSFKIAFACGCINEGTKEGLSKLFRESNDLGLFTEIEVLKISNFNVADSLGRLYFYKIQPINYLDAGDKKPIVSRCLYFALSNELDTLAKQNFERFIMNNKENE